MATLFPSNSRAVRFGSGLRTVNSDCFQLILQAVAFWNVWWTLGLRFADSGYFAWELVPLISVSYFAWAGRPAEDSRSEYPSLLPATFCLGAYTAAIVLGAPPMLRALIAMVSLTFALSRWRFGTTFHPGVLALLLLCLPVTDSLNFFLGYPMRAAVGEMTTFLLNLQGLTVFRDAVNLQFGERLIVIDAPCSGIKMLWFATLLANVLSIQFRLSAGKYFLVLAATFIAVMLGNVARASALFYIESGLIDSPAWMHSAVGVTGFGITSMVILVFVIWTSGVKWRS